MSWLHFIIKKEDFGIIANETTLGHSMPFNNEQSRYK